MKRATLLALFAMAGSTAAAVASSADENLVVVAVDDAVSADGFLVGVEAGTPFAIATPTLPVGGDGRVRVGFGRILHLSRSDGVLSVVDPATWSVVETHSLGASTEPRDMALVSATSAWISRRGQAELVRIDLESGVVEATVDLSALGVSAGVLSMETLLVFDGRLYVQLVRPLGSFLSSFVAVVDLASDTVIDADPAAPGLQAIELQGTQPRFKMQIVPGTRRLMLSNTGASLDFGGLEILDLDLLVSEGIVLEEFIDVSLNDLGPFVMLDEDRGWYSGSTDIVLSSHLHPFTLSGGGHTPEAASVLFYFAPALAYDAGTDTIFWPVPTGLRAFDATTGVERTSGVTLLPGEATDLALFPSAPAVSVGVGPALAAWLMAVGAWALREH